MEKMKFETVDGTVRNVDKIAEMFPQVVTEVLVGKDKLKREVFRESFIASSLQKINEEKIFKLLFPSTTVKVI